jgi:hypothetical protein
MRYGTAAALLILYISSANAQQLAMTDSANGPQKSRGTGNPYVSYSKYPSLQNPAAYIPSQCYTKTEDDGGNTHNPCYACHTTSKRPNYINDPDFQVLYDFSEDPRTNRWTNLFKDRSADVAAISDREVREYIRKSNYFDSAGRIKLSDRLTADLPKAWDFNGNGRWDGLVPDLWYNFDEEGFDRNPQGDYSGWRAFAYYPFLGTFWPTNGSTDDVLIRLPDEYRQNADGEYDHSVYKINLAIVEAMIREQDIAIEPVDEAAVGSVDLDKDGEIGIASKIVYDWAPLKKRFMWYVGKAHGLQQQGKIKIAAGLYPKGTEFLHTVRYIDFNSAGEVILSERIKELRYAKKHTWLTYSKMKDVVDSEFKERHDFPNRLRTIMGNHETGVSNGQGWTYAAFIEDAQGELRPQTYEELAFCVGCHGGVGATSDGIFAFERKLEQDQFRHGWYHWSQKGIKGLADPKRMDGKHEYSFYLEQNSAGDEFRANSEILQEFFTADGALRPDRVALMQKDISRLLWPSQERAMILNKAYLVIAREQSYILGRDATVTSPVNVHQKLDAAQPTGISPPVVAEKLFIGNGD